MKMTLLLILFYSFASFGQSLHDARILKISDRKRSIFMDKGIFHYESEASNQSLENLRNSYDANRGYERLVFDFAGGEPPRVYGMINQNEKKRYIDFLNIGSGRQLKPLKNKKYVKAVDCFTLDVKDHSVEFNFKEKVSLNTSL